MESLSVLSLLYLKIVFYWPEFYRLQSKHFAVTLPDFIYNITILIYYFVLTVCNTLHILLLLNKMKSVKKMSQSFIHE